VEVLPLASQRVIDAIKKLFPAAEVKLRSFEKNVNTPFVTDNSNWIVDIQLHGKYVSDPRKIENLLKTIPGVLEVGLFNDMVSECIFAEADGKVNIRTRVPSDLNPKVSKAQQHDALTKVLNSVKEFKKAHPDKTPVVEMDLDLTTTMPYGRTIGALALVAKNHKIEEFKDPQFSIGSLPGYTPEAFKNWLSKDFKAKYPHVNWEDAEKQFETEFWRDGPSLAFDVITPGVVEFENAIHDAGGAVVFISGRWLDSQIQASNDFLYRCGIPSERVHLVIGNENHDTVDDAANKVLQQPKIKVQYGEPVAVFDDRVANVDAIDKANDGKLVKVVVAIPGYSAADVGPEYLVTSTFKLS